MKFLAAIKYEWCRAFHGGGYVMRDLSGRINWQCFKCGRWADPVSESEEKNNTDHALVTARAEGEV